jgi:hypothetical protein
VTLRKGDVMKGLWGKVRGFWARRARVGTKGAVYVEFLIAFIPLFTFFMCMVQISFLRVAQLVNRHAAVVAARAAIVILPDDPAGYGGEAVGAGTGQRLDAITRAAKSALMAVTATPAPKVTLTGGSGGTANFGNDGLVKVKVEFEYTCLVPVAAQIACGLDKKVTFVAEATMPIQGALYEYPEGDREVD